MESIGITPCPGNLMMKSGLFPSDVFSCSVYIIPFVRLAMSRILRRVISPQSPLAVEDPVSAVLSLVAFSPRVCVCFESSSICDFSTSCRLCLSLLIDSFFSLILASSIFMGSTNFSNSAFCFCNSAAPSFCLLSKFSEASCKKSSRDCFEI